MAEITNAGEGEMPKMTPAMRYYYQNREDKKAKDLARYHNRPDVIAKKEERLKKRIEKEEQSKTQKQTEKEAKRIERERIRQEKIELALATKRQFKSKTEGTLNSFLDKVSPAEINLS